MSICVVDGKHCQCSPSEGFPCPGVVELREKYAIAQHAADCLEAKCNALEMDRNAFEDELKHAKLANKENERALRETNDWLHDAKAQLAACKELRRADRNYRNTNDERNAL
jgi:hypothetical protein